MTISSITLEKTKNTDFVEIYVEYLLWKYCARVLAYFLTFIAAKKYILQIKEDTIFFLFFKFIKIKVDYWVNKN